MWPSASRITGRSGMTPSMGWVTMYMCSQAWSGIVTPLRRPSSWAHMPAALTTISLAMPPADVSPPATALPAGPTPVTPPAPPPRQRLGDVGRVGLAVARDPHRAHQIVRAHQRVERERFREPDLLGLDAVGARERGVAPELRHALRVAGDAQAAAALPARGLPRLGLELAVEPGAVADELGEIARGPELPHEPGRVPGGAAAHAPLLEQDQVTPPELRQMIGDAAPDNAAAADHHPRMSGHARGHRAPLMGCQGGAAPRRRSP